MGVEMSTIESIKLIKNRIKKISKFDTFVILKTYKYDNTLSPTM